MTDFIVDAANFRTLARMSDSSGVGFHAELSRFFHREVSHL
ncbi:hypothetical protein [Rhizobium anhuiense]|nr:hypothetical protein [Rhizobium anhuiense]